MITNQENRKMDQDEKSRAELNEEMFPGENLLNKLEETPENNDQISELSKKGYLFLKEDNIQEAVKSFSEILKQEENNNYALVGLGDSERKQNHFPEAIKYYSECLKFYPENSYALFGLADCYKSLNQYQKAIKIWEQYLSHDDKNITVLTRIADAYRKIHDFKRSKEIYTKVLKIEENNPYALIGLGHLHYDFKEYKNALHYWTKMYEINQEHLDIRVLTSIGNCHRKLKSFEKGIFFFSKAIDMEPKNFYALFGMADCYRGLNQQKNSIEYWNKILDIDPNNKVILTRIGDAFRNLKDFDKATEYYNRALNIDFDTYAALGLALICKEQKRYNEACERLENLIKNDQKNYRLYIDLADCYIKMNNKQNAILTLERFQTLGTRSSAVSELLEALKK